MFERYTEAARRVVFFARYEAVMREASEITPLYILLGLLREGDAASALALRLPGNKEAICNEIRLPAQKLAKYPGGEIQIPLDRDAKLVLGWTAHEADSDSSEKIGPVYLVRGLLCFPNPAATVLNGVGIELDSIRAAARDGKFRVELGRRVRFQLRLVAKVWIWPSIRNLALILGFALLAILILHLFGLG